MLGRCCVLLLVLMLPQAAAARVYMCVDPQTGKTSFTDKACAETSTGEEVRVNGANYSSGRKNAPAANGPHFWANWPAEKVCKPTISVHWSALLSRIRARMKSP